MFPQLSTVADELAVIRSMTSKVNEHAQGNYAFHTRVSVYGPPVPQGRGCRMDWGRKTRTCPASWCCNLAGHPFRTGAWDCSAAAICRRKTRAPSLLGIARRRCAISVPVRRGSHSVPGSISSRDWMKNSSKTSVATTTSRRRCATTRPRFACSPPCRSYAALRARLSPRKKCTAWTPPTGRSPATGCSVCWHGDWWSAACASSS